MRGTLVLLVLLAASVAGNGYQLYKAGGAAPKCQVALDNQVNQQATATQQDQHKADAQNVKDVKRQQVKMNEDSASDAGEIAGLQTKVHAQQETLDELKKQYDALGKKANDPGRCLSIPVPAALIGSLQFGSGGAAQPPGGSDPLRR